MIIHRPNASAAGGGRRTAKAGVDQAPSLLSLYGDAPTGEISMEEFEGFAIKRLRVLKGIEGEKAKNTKPAPYEESVRASIKEHMENGTARMKMEERVRQDQLSHYALRLAYCKTDDQRRWFITHEAALFRHRFETEKQKSVKMAFLQKHNIRVDIIQLRDCHPELKVRLEELSQSQPSFNEDGKRFVPQEYLKVPFEEVLDSVKRRKALLHMGDAYVPSTELLTFVEPRFKMELSKELTRSSKVIHLVEQDTRLQPILAFLRVQYMAFGAVNESSVAVTGTLNLSNLESAYKQAFPPCMMQMRERMKTTHHLKWDGRKQMGAFLKRAGLTMEDSMSWWKTNFTGSHVTPEKFEKEYAYAVRYLYGKEGNGHGYKPYTCMRMIMGEPPNERDGKIHGCPFKTMSEDQLTLMLRKLGISGTDLKETVELAKAENFQIACQKGFNARYGVEDTDVVTHPNDYYDKAMLLNEEKAARAANPAGASQSQSQSQAGGSQGSQGSSPMQGVANTQGGKLSAGLAQFANKA